MGSTFMPRIAGTATASSTTIINDAPTDASVIGSVGPMPNRLVRAPHIRVSEAGLVDAGEQQHRPRATLSSGGLLDVGRRFSIAGRGVLLRACASDAATVASIAVSYSARRYVRAHRSSHRHHKRLTFMGQRALSACRPGISARRERLHPQPPILEEMGQTSGNVRRGWAVALVLLFRRRSI